MSEIGLIVSGHYEVLTLQTHYVLFTFIRRTFTLEWKIKVIVEDNMLPFRSILWFLSLGCWLFWVYFIYNSRHFTFVYIHLSNICWSFRVQTKCESASWLNPPFFTNVNACTKWGIRQLLSIWLMCLCFCDSKLSVSYFSRSSILLLFYFFKDS